MWCVVLVQKSKPKHVVLHVFLLFTPIICVRVYVYRCVCVCARKEFTVWMAISLSCQSDWRALSKGNELMRKLFLKSNQVPVNWLLHWGESKRRQSDLNCDQREDRTLSICLSEDIKKRADRVMCFYSYYSLSYKSGTSKILWICELS